MKLPLESSTRSSDPPRSFRDRVFTITPVILTVLATLLAGLSNSEMTQAQYHRSLAAQTQSKVGDEWSFFQARRTRASLMELGFGLLPQFTPPDRLDADQLCAASDRLLACLRRAAALDTRIEQAFPPHSIPKPRPAETLVEQAEHARTQLRHALEQSATAEALALFGAAKLPDQQLGPPRDPAIRDLLTRIAANGSDLELAELLRLVRPTVLQEHIDEAEADAAAFEAKTADLTRHMSALTPLVHQQITVARSMLARLTYADTALADRPDEARTAAVRNLETDIGRTAVQLKNAVEALATTLKAAEFEFESHRYRAEAKTNQRIANLYEIRVRYEGGLSERHRQRSKNFFYGMLFAQIGVTVASLALATQRRSALWTFAGVAGLTASVFSLYVYLYS